LASGLILFSRRGNGGFPLDIGSFPGVPFLLSFRVRVAWKDVLKPVSADQFFLDFPVFNFS
jgi:hypothetical protein